MLPSIEKVKRLHPGAVLKRELKKRHIKSIALANDIQEHPQTINAITKERRGINAKLSYKLGEYFNTTHDYFMIIQAIYEVETFRKANTINTNSIIGQFRKSLFWDTRIELIDHEKHKRSIIQRVLERGNHKEIKNLIKLYSLSTIKKEIQEIDNSFIPKYQENIDKYIKGKN